MVSCTTFNIKVLKQDRSIFMHIEVIVQCSNWHMIECAIKFWNKRIDVLEGPVISRSSS